MLRPGLAAALICAALALTGCGGDETPTSRPTPTTATRTPTPTPTPTVPVIEKPSLPPATKGPKGQEAFATYVVEGWTYALATNDASILTDVSAGKKPCLGCRELEAELATRASAGWSVYPFDVTIDKVKLSQSNLGTNARIRFDVPETKSFFDDGSLRNTNPAHPNSIFTVSMRLGKTAYELIGFTVG
jgi:hypothetical protein